jgi:hypothetical protein
VFTLLGMKIASTSLPIYAMMSTAFYNVMR